MRSICMCLHHVEVCTHLYMVLAGSFQKYELHSCGGGGGGNIPGDNLWSDSVTGDCGSFGGGGGGGG